MITNPLNHSLLHTIMTYYDILKDAHASPSVMAKNNELLYKALKSVITDEAEKKIKELNITQPHSFFDTFENAINGTSYTIKKKIGRIQHISDKPQNKLPDFIKIAIEESGIKPIQFAADIESKLSIASYIDPFPSRTQTQTCFSYDHSQNPKVLNGPGLTRLTKSELYTIGIHGINTIEGKIDGSSWECETKIVFDHTSSPLTNRFSNRFIETGHYGNEYGRYFAGNPTKNTWFNSNTGVDKKNIAIKFILCKEIGDSLQVLLASKFKESLEETENSVCIFSCDSVVGKRSRLLKVNSLIKNYGNEPIGALYDECILYLAEKPDIKKEIESIIATIKKNVIEHNKNVITMINGAIENGFDIPTSRSLPFTPEIVANFLINDIINKIKEVNITIDNGFIETEASSPGIINVHKYPNIPTDIKEIESYEKAIKKLKACHIFFLHKATGKYRLIRTEKYMFADGSRFSQNQSIGDIIEQNLSRNPKRPYTNTIRDSRRVRVISEPVSQEVLQPVPQTGGGLEDDYRRKYKDKDLFDMIHDPNSLLEKKVIEYYGEKGEDYLYGLMNTLYHVFDYINEISVDKEILDLINNEFNKEKTLPVSEFDNLFNSYQRIKNNKINNSKVNISIVNITRKTQVRNLKSERNLRATAANKRAANKRAANKRAANQIAVNPIAANPIAANPIDVNPIDVYSGYSGYITPNDQKRSKNPTDSPQSTQSRDFSLYKSNTNSNISTLYRGGMTRKSKKNYD